MAGNWRTFPSPGSSLLRWMSDDYTVDVDSGTFRPPKIFGLEARWRSRSPKVFHVFEFHESWVGRLRKKWREDPREHVTWLPVTRSGPTRAKADEPWNLPLPRHKVGKRVFRFTDRDEETPDDAPWNWSAEIVSSRFGDVHVRVPMKAKLPVGEAGIDLGGTYRNAIDPPVRLVLLAPWGEGEESLEYMVDVARGLGETDLDLAEASASDIEREFERYLPTAPPPTWRVSLTDAEFWAEEDEEVTFGVRLEAANPGQTLLAIKAVNVNNDEEFVVSDVFELTVDPPSVFIRDTLELLSPQPAEEAVRQASRRVEREPALAFAGEPIELGEW